jgi:putative flippase GtrA
VLKQFIHYNAVGVVNTIVGFGLIVLLMRGGISPVVSNAIGYGVGAILSYYLNNKYTFDQKKQCVSHATKFFTILLASYLLNMISLKWFLVYIDPYIAQAMAAVVYSTSGFVLAKFLIYNQNKESNI